MPAAHRDRDARGKRYTVAYGAFLVSGVVTALFSVAVFTAGSDGLFVDMDLSALMLLSLVMVAGIVIGWVFSFLLRPDRRLFVLSIAAFLFLAELMGGAGPPAFYHLVVVTYALLAIGVPLWWFLRGRGSGRARKGV